MGTLSNKYFNAQAVEDALDKGVAAYDSMGQIELVYNGTDIRFNNEVVNFQQIVDYITTDARFCYMVYNNRVLLTSDMQLTGGTRYVFFETSTTDSGLSKNTVVKVYSSNGTTISSITHSTIANENFSNKVSTIADNDKNSTVHYPSNKAVTEITDEIKEDLSELSNIVYGTGTNFFIRNGHTHSSLDDEITIKIYAGEKVKIDVISKEITTSVTTTLTATYADGTESKYSGKVNQSIELTAEKEIAKLGLFVGTVSQDSNVEFRIILNNSIYSDVTRLDSNLSASNTRIDSLESKISTLEISSKGHNLIGKEADVYYPVYIPKGTEYTFSTADGETETKNTWLIFYDKDKNQVNTMSVYNCAVRTGSSNKDVYYVSWKYVPNAVPMFNTGSEALPYEEYFEGAYKLNDVVKQIQENKVSINSTGISGEMLLATTSNGNPYWKGNGTSPEIEFFGKLISDSTFELIDNINACVTRLYPIPLGNYHNKKISYNLKKEGSFSGKVFYTLNGEILAFNSTNPDGTDRNVTISYDGEIDGLIFNLANSKNSLANSFAYWQQTKEVIFAGSSTIYNGLKFIDNKSAERYGEFAKYYPEQVKVLDEQLGIPVQTRATESERLQFVHISDNHGGGIPSVVKSIVENSNAKFIINTGDLVADRFDDSFDTTANSINSLEKPCYITLGNHDVNHAPSTLDIWNKYFATTNEHNGLTTEKTYYSVNFSVAKVKCIFLDQYDNADYSDADHSIHGGNLSEEQLNWFAQELQNAIDNKYHVVIFMHCITAKTSPKDVNPKFTDYIRNDLMYTKSECVTKIVQAFMDGSSTSFVYNNKNYSYSFTGKGNFVSYFTGHTHWDVSGYLTDYPNQYFVTTTQCSSSGPYNGWISNNRLKFVCNYVSIDTENRKLSIYRCGNQETRWGENRDKFTIMY